MEVDEVLRRLQGPTNTVSLPSLSISDSLDPLSEPMFTSCLCNVAQCTNTTFSPIVAQHLRVNICPEQQKSG